MVFTPPLDEVISAVDGLLDCVAAELQLNCVSSAAVGIVVEQRTVSLPGVAFPGA